MFISYKWLKTYFNDTLPAPEKVAEALTFGVFEVEGMEKKGDDVIFDVKVLPDRAHDCLSHRGIARELSALLDIDILEKPTADLHTVHATLSVNVEDNKKCRRYIGRIVRNVTVGQSPDWLRERLEAIGQRSINNIVDATNYVMFDIGQPLHAFDLNKYDVDARIQTNENYTNKIIVRKTQAGEKITTLDERETVLGPGTLVIAGEKDVLAIAGVKGGNKAKVDEGTAGIILEAANFEPVTVRKTSRGLGIITDSSKRFENELTPELAREAMERVTALIMDIAGNKSTVVEDVVDIYPEPQNERTITLGSNDVNRLLGTRISDKEMSEFLDRLHLNYAEEGNPASFTVFVPIMRLDMLEKADIAEDIGRIYGYGNITPVEQNSAEVKVNKKFYYVSFIRKILTDAGFSEIYGYTFAATGDIELANPPAEGRQFLRRNLFDGIISSLAHNARYAELLGFDTVKLFEIGNIFTMDGEHTSLAIGVESSFDGKRGVALSDSAIRGTIDLLSQKLGIELESAAGNVWEVNFDLLIKNLPEPPESYDTVLSEKPTTISYKKISPYPFIVRDIAVWVPEGTDIKGLIGIIASEGGALMARHPALFDEFKKDGKTSYAFRLVFQAPDRTLTDEEANVIMEKITKIFQERGFHVR